MIAEGAVRVNGTVERSPERLVNLHSDRIEVSGRSVSSAQPVHLALNKPRGVVTTRSDERGRRNVYEFLPPECAWVAPVGRLDMASAGLLILTNDNALAELLTAPHQGLLKRYRVKVRGAVDPATLERMTSGVHDEELGVLRAARVELERTTTKGAWLTIWLDEGRNRQIRRMAEALGLEVQELIRTAIGPLELGTLAPGAVRALTAEEVRSLRAAVQRGG